MRACVWVGVCAGGALLVGIDVGVVVGAPVNVVVGAGGAAELDVGGTAESRQPSTAAIQGCVYSRDGFVRWSEQDDEAWYPAQTPQMAKWNFLA